MSTIRNDNSSADEHDCLFQPKQVECSDLDFVLSTILSKELFWIHTIVLNELTLTENGESVVPKQWSILSRGIQIICLNSCVFNTNWTISAEVFQTTFVIQLENILFQNAIIAVGNVHMVFKNIQFVNSVITDWIQSDGEFDEIELQFVQASFVSQSLRTTWLGLEIDKVFSASIFVISSNWNNVSTQISVPNVLFYSSESSFINSNVLLQKHMLLYCVFHNVLFIGFGEGNTETAMLKMAGNKLIADFTNCHFDSTTGLEISKQASGLLASFVQAEVQNCIFQNNKKLGSGGAILVNFFAPKLVTSTDLNFIKVANSTLTHNEALSVGALPSQGGAISVSSQGNAQSCSFLSVEVETSDFTNNRAADQGGALFASDKCLKLRIYNSSFSVTDQRFDSPRGVFICSYSDISISSTIMSRQLKQHSTSLVELQVLSEMAQIKELGIVVQCPTWHKLGYVTSFVQMQAKQVQISCASCQESFYVPSDGHFHIALLPNQTGLSVDGATIKAGIVTCIPCPAGAICSGNNIIASPNFWGYRGDDAITMYQCPAEYCCTGDCTGYNQCSGHRTGMLCGSCEENYSLSMLSSQCIPQNLCNDHWLWPMVIVAIVLYMVWYTFKNDVFAIPTYIAGKICKTCSKSSDVSEVTYVDKGYFGIITYFTQIKAVMFVALELQSGRTVDESITQAESYIGLLLNFELTYMSNDTCALKGVTTTTKVIFKFLFLVGVIITWNIVFIFFSILKKILSVRGHNIERVDIFSQKLISGLLEIIKYTYSGFCSVMFYSLVCTSVAGNQVWFYDATVQCYSKWQAVMLIFGLTFILPYPILFFVGAKLIEKNKISGYTFLIACCFPLPALVFWCFFPQHKEQKTHDDVHFNKVESAIYDGLTGGFRESEDDTQCWEAVLMLRRLLIGSTILIPNVSIQLTTCLALCLVFLIHHLYRNPFVYHISNKAEAISLVLLCGIASMNLVKTFVLFSENNIQDPQWKILQNMNLFETLNVLFLIAFIASYEVVETLCSACPRKTGPDLEDKKKANAIM